MTSWEFWSFTFFYNSKLLVLAQAAIRVNIYIYCHGGVIGTGQDTAGPLPDLRSPPPSRASTGSVCFTRNQWEVCRMMWVTSHGKSQFITRPETNSKSLWKWMVGIRSFPFGKVHFQRQIVGSKECKFPTSIAFRNHDFMLEFYARKGVLIGMWIDVRFGRNETSQSVPRNHDQSTPAANTPQTFCLHT